MKITYFVRVLLLVCTSFCSLTSKAQFGYTEFKYFEGFETAKIAIVRTGDQAMDTGLESAFKKYWTINEFFFITGKDIPQHTGKKDVYFITLIELTHMSTVGYKVFKLCLIDDILFKRNGEIDFEKMDMIATAQFSET